MDPSFSVFVSGGALAPPSGLTASSAAAASSRAGDSGAWLTARELVAQSSLVVRPPPTRNPFAILGGTCWAMPYGIQIGAAFKTRPTMAQLRPRDGFAPPRMAWKYSPEARVTFYHLVRTFPDLLAAIQSGVLVHPKDSTPLANVNQYVYGLSESCANEIANWLLDVNGNPRETLQPDVIMSCKSSFAVIGSPLPASTDAYSPVDDVDDIWSTVPIHRFEGLDTVSPAFLSNFFDDDLAELSKSETGASSFATWGGIDVAKTGGRPRAPSVSSTVQHPLPFVPASSDHKHTTSYVSDPFELSYRPPSPSSTSGSRCSSRDPRDPRDSSVSSRRSSRDFGDAAAFFAPPAVAQPLPAMPLSREIWNALYDEYLRNCERGLGESAAQAAVSAATTGSIAPLAPLLRDAYSFGFGGPVGLHGVGPAHSVAAVPPGLAGGSFGLAPSGFGMLQAKSGPPEYATLAHPSSVSLLAAPITRTSSPPGVVSSAASVASVTSATSGRSATSGVSAKSGGSDLSTAVPTVGADGLSAIVRPFCRNKLTAELDAQVTLVLRAVTLAPECIASGSTKMYLGIGFREVLKCVRRSTLHAVIIATDIERNTTEDLGRRIDILTSECRALGIPYAFDGTRQALAVTLGKSGSISCVGFIRVPDLLPDLVNLAEVIGRANAAFGC